MLNLTETENLTRRGEDILAQTNGAEKARGNGGKRKVEQFGNNFFLLFDTMRISEDERGALSFYVDRAKSYGNKWNNFLEQNVELIADINRALDGLSSYNLAIGHLTDLLNEGLIDEARAFSKAIDPDLGTNALGIPQWDRLNPLLEQAANKMQEVGINPQEFFS